MAIQKLSLLERHRFVITWAYLELLTPGHEKRNSFKTGEPENSGLSRIQLSQVSKHSPL